MNTMRLVILLLITLLFLEGLGAYQESKQAIRKIVREEIQNETSNR